MERWNPPYEGEDVRDVRGIALPEDYLMFMRVHNGGKMTRMDGGDEFVLTLFLVEDVLSGERYMQNGFWLGSERSVSQEYQNISTQTVTTLGGVHPDDAPALYKVFFDNHVVIGCQTWQSGRHTCYDLIAIDHAGYYRVLEDGAAEELPMHAFGVRVDTPHGGYVKYNKSVYETPFGLIEPCYDGYRAIPAETIEVLKGKYDAYRAPQRRWEAGWPYAGGVSKTAAWKGSSMEEVLEFFRSGEM